MKIETRYNISDCVETLLWDIWYITWISLFSCWYKYCIRFNEDKEMRLYDWQIKGLHE